MTTSPSSLLPPPFPRLLADIGGTNARFALETAPEGTGGGAAGGGTIERLIVLPSKDYPTLADALTDYLSRVGAPPLRHAAFGIANPVTGDRVQMTNHHWSFSIAETRDRFGLETLLVLNDFTVLALSLPALAAADLVQVGGGAPDPGGAKALIGPGTGLGVSGLLPAPHGQWVPIAGEGGHVAFSPVTEQEVALWRFACQTLGLPHLSAERLLSGSGLELIDRFLTETGTAPQRPPRTAPEISAAGLDGSCPQAVAALSLFCAVLGTAASNLALTLGATGGVYIGGGIVPRLGDFLHTSPFRTRFEAQGRMDAFVRPIPVYVIHAATPALTGASVALTQHLTITTGH